MNQRVDQRQAQRMAAAAINTDLLRLALEGDLVLWEAALEQHSRYLRRVAYSYGFDHHMVEVIVGTTWLGLIQHAPNVRYPEELAGWLRTTLERKFLQTIGHRNHRRSAGDPSTHLSAAFDAPPPSGRLPQSTGLTELRQALAALSVRDRRLLLQFASDDGWASTISFSAQTIFERIRIAWRRVALRRSPRYRLLVPGSLPIGDDMLRSSGCSERSRREDSP